MEQQEFEYKFVRLDFSKFIKSSKPAEEEYQNVIQEHAKKGWRLVQIFAPGDGTYGSVRYYEIVLERRVQSSKTP
ncbi:MAG: DUF4177 domain-containing protein [Candidatus Kapabacteria bacterium]|jgi:hypothetical protein|nr:DUF4177 domain-containing protein [Candidatus Kapabacteria bacterium]